MPSRTEDRPTTGSLAAAVSNMVVRVLREYTGRGPTKARTTIHDNMIVVLLQQSLLKAERSLIADGKTELVLQTRHEFQRTMRDQLVANVELLTERTVVAFMSANHVEPDLAAEIFILDPAAPTED